MLGLAISGALETDGDESTPIEFALNGKQISAHCRADMTVLEWLRQDALLRGTKEGCAEGDCGACSVLYSRDGNATYLPANSCILLMGQIAGGSLVTVEGLAEGKEGPHPVQEKMAENGSSQCGFCTPGIVVSLAGLLAREKQPSEDAIHDALAGNLCRCTGYRPIVEAAMAAAFQTAAPLPEASVEAPAGLVGVESSHIHLPETLDALLKLREDKPDAVLLAGGTDLAIAVAHARERWPEIISTRRVGELREIGEADGELTFGGAVTWEEALPIVAKRWPDFATLIRRFGSVQIRAMGTIAGNLCTASPIGDGAPALLALGAEVTLANTNATRRMKLEDFFLDYRKSALAADEVLAAIHVPLTDAQFHAYKVSKRFDQDISTVCGAFSVTMDGENVKACRIAYGGMAATPRRVPDAEKALIGSTLGDDAIATARKAVFDTFTPMSDMRGTADYRSRVAANLIDRLALDLQGVGQGVMAL